MSPINFIKHQEQLMNKSINGSPINLSQVANAVFTAQFSYFKRIWSMILLAKQSPTLKMGTSYPVYYILLFLRCWWVKEKYCRMSSVIFFFFFGLGIEKLRTLDFCSGPEWVFFNILYTYSSGINMNEHFQGPFVPLILTFRGLHQILRGNWPKGPPYFDPSLDILRP